MNVVRLLVVLLLSLAVPAFGFAGVATVETPCPMEQASTAPVGPNAAPDTSWSHAQQSHGCCDDGDGQVPSESGCKSGQECHGAHVVVLATAIALPGPVPDRLAAAERPAAHVPHVWASFWRPPRLG